MKMTSASLPDFDNFVYCVVSVPAGARLRAWQKLQECERRLAFYKWVEALNDPATPRYHVLLDDALSALLLTIEATLQFVHDQFKVRGKWIGLSAWLKTVSDYGLEVKALRTLRHLAAHVEIKKSPSLVAITPGSPDPVTRTWRLPIIEPGDLSKLNSSTVSAADLPAWKNLVLSQSASELLERGLTQLASLVAQAENVF